MRRALALAVLVLALAPAAAVAEARGAPPPQRQETTLHLAARGGDAVLTYPFEVDAPSEVYAKLVPTPWSPVVPSGASNGSVSPDRSAGLRGWWVRFAVAPSGGPAADLGHYSDAAPTPRLALDAGVHALEVSIHAPADAGPAGTIYRLDLALARLDPRGGVEGTQSFAAEVRVVGAGGGAPLPEGAAWGLLGGAALLAAGAALLAVRRRRGPAEPWL